MSGLLDTNVIVRYVVGEGTSDALRAEAILAEDDDLRVSALVIAEAGWVLSTFYRMPRHAIVDVLIAVLRRRNIRPLDMKKSTAIRALMLCRPSGRVSFTDAMTWALARASGIGVVYTFDQRFPSDGIEVRGSAP